MYSGLKCQLSGDAPQGPWSSINDVNYSGCVCCYPNPVSVTQVLDCVYALFDETQYIDQVVDCW